MDGWREEANSYPVPNGHDQPVSPTRCRFSNSNLRQPFRATISGKVTANDNADSESVQEIRAHLTHIAVMFSNGDFSSPMFVHSQSCTGVGSYLPCGCCWPWNVLAGYFRILTQ